MFSGYSSLVLFSRLLCNMLLCFPVLSVSSFPFFLSVWQMKLQCALKSSLSLTLFLLLLYFGNRNVALLTTIIKQNQLGISECAAQCQGAARAASQP